MKNIIIKILSAAATSMLLASVAQAEIAVIVNNSVSVSSISVDEAANIYLGKMGELPGGIRMVPIDQEDGQKARTEFYNKVVKKDAAQLNAYWSRLIFTGKGEPPKKMADNADVLALVAANPNIIGYVDASAVNSSVKVLLKVP
jgi:ABC-type phosphate transport system substrate-binding protein